MGIDGIEDDRGGLVIPPCPQQQFGRVRRAVAIGGRQSERAQRERDRLLGLFEGVESAR